ncbi:MAG TPA: sigma factor-like helix-turn-helix DNA-binding protein, partial [Solirubrobacterales bacterium]
HAKHFPREWIKEWVPEIMSQARTDFAARLAVEQVDDAVSLLVVIAYRRAIKFVRAERSRPKETSIENFFHLADESTPTPEQETLDHDRQETLVRVMGELPERERRLLALIYFNDMEIGAAGRRLGWSKASATRHHQAALERLRELVGDRELLGVEVAIPAFVISRDHAPPRAALMWIEGAAETLRDSMVLGGGRLGPLAETGNAAAMGGAGRTAAGVCGAALVACLAGAATGVVGPGIDAKETSPPSRAHPARETSTASPHRQPAGGTDGAATQAPERSTGDRGEAGSLERSPSPASRSIPEPRERAATSNPPTASAAQTVNEFGLESGEAEESAASPSGATENTPVSPQSSSVARPATSSGNEGTPKPSGSSSSGSQTSSEFGM